MKRCLTKLASYNLMIMALSILASVTVVACGGNSNTSTAIPQPVDPTAGTGRLDNTSQSPNADLVEWKDAFPITLANYSSTNLNYASLMAFFPGFTAPLVSDALILWKVTMQASSTSATPTITSSLKLGAEDRLGFWKRSWVQQFPGTEAKTATNLDVIYSDTQISVRVSATIDPANNNIYGNITYRPRLNNETQCQRVSWTCQPAGSNCQLPPDTSAQDCKVYMSSNAQTLGTFTGTFSTIVKAQGL